MLKSTSFLDFFVGIFELCFAEFSTENSTRIYIIPTQR